MSSSLRRGTKREGLRLVESAKEGDYRWQSGGSDISTSRDECLSRNQGCKSAHSAHGCEGVDEGGGNEKESPPSDTRVYQTYTISDNTGDSGLSTDAKAGIGNGYGVLHEAISST